MEPLSSEHRKALETCHYCANLCRSRCPVAQAEAIEPAVPTFKMKLALWTAEGHVPLDQSAATAFYKCTGCLNSRSACRHDVAVDSPLREARQRSVQAGVAPESVSDLKEKYQRCGSPYSVDLKDELKRQVGDLSSTIKESANGQVTLAPSCASVARDAPEVKASVRVMDKIHGEKLDVVAPGCCGYPLYEMGLQDEFEDQAKRYFARVKDAERLIVTSPTCAWLLRFVYPSLGLELPPSHPMAVELDEHRESLQRWSKEKQAAEKASAEDNAKVEGDCEADASTDQDILYHDACFMGRRLGYYEEPRRVLSAVTGIWPREMADKKEHSLCSGAGAGYRWTHPESSLEVARQCLNQAPEGHKNATLVSACPSSRRQFRLVDGEQKAASLAEIVAGRIFV
ncbi:MAG: (Fe-S)-binding protein [Planctomycetota bacterium]|nr:(Fe-S)-binding protein [Planctomycetota bacterium]